MPANNNYRHLFVGLDAKVPLLNGSKKTYINLDNAASTPPLVAVQDTINDFMVYYSSVHRGTGYKSQLSTHMYEQARDITIKFVGGDSRTHTCIFGKNTTEAINKLAKRFPFSSKRDVVLTSGLEHHSNDLPWRNVANTIHIGLTPEGRIDINDFDEKLAQYKDRLALVAITGASNVTGYLSPIYELAEKSHRVGAQIIVDCAQLAPHRKLDMLSLDDPAHLDFVTISAHKMYAPFGTGALIGRCDIFELGDPDMRGGGTVEIVTLDDVVWAKPPDRDEAGSPNTIGAVSLAAAILQLQSLGMDSIARHESILTSHALDHLNSVKGIRIFGEKEISHTNFRLGVIPFELDGMSHFQVAAILGYEFGIGVRSGCFCAHPYILHLLKLTPEESDTFRRTMLSGDKSNMPGLIRASFGLYNTKDEVDELVEALGFISRGEYKGIYTQNTATGEFTPQGWAPHFSNYFSISKNN